VGIVFLLLFAALIIWSFGVEPRWLRIRKVSIKLKTSLRRPLTVLHISDSHFPLHLKTLKRFFKELSCLNPDLVVLTGDIIDSDLGVEACAQAVSQLKSRFGMYAVLGNHDHFYYGAREIIGFLFTSLSERFHPRKRNDVVRLKKRLLEAGCRVLTNESVDLLLDEQKLCLVGLDDPVTKQADAEKAFQNVNGADLKILLTHSMDVLQRMNGYSVDLVLGGHTHGGQVSLPFYGSLPMKMHSRMGRKFVAGLNHCGGAITYTSRGIGEGKFLPFRFLCRPEAVLFEIL